MNIICFVIAKRNKCTGTINMFVCFALFCYIFALFCSGKLCSLYFVSFFFVQLCFISFHTSFERVFSSSSATVSWFRFTFCFFAIFYRYLSWRFAFACLPLTYMLDRSLLRSDWRRYNCAIVLRFLFTHIRAPFWTLLLGFRHSPAVNSKIIRCSVHTIHRRSSALLILPGQY